jgi:Na+-translocating ferredoxin:NAD+ oxidoreductase RNF subunit RnfB
LLELANRTDFNSYDHFITELFATANCLGCPQCFAALDADCDVMSKKIVLVGVK